MFIVGRAANLHALRHYYTTLHAHGKVFRYSFLAYAIRESNPFIFHSFEIRLFYGRCKCWIIFEQDQSQLVPTNAIKFSFGRHILVSSAKTCGFPNKHTHIIYIYICYIPKKRLRIKAKFIGKQQTLISFSLLPHPQSNSPPPYFSVLLGKLYNSRCTQIYRLL